MLWGAAARATAADAVTISIEGDVDRSCSVTLGSASIDLGDLTAPKAGETPFDFSCNAPFTFTVSSRSGALSREGGPPPTVGQFLEAAPYRVTATVPFDDAGAGSVSDCLSSALTDAAPGACRTVSSGSSTSIAQQGVLKIQPEDVKIPLLAGKYSDIVTIRLAVAL